MNNQQLAIVETSRSRNPNDQDHPENSDDEEIIRDIHALTPPRPPNITNIYRSSSLSVASEATSSENFTTMSREFNALVIAGSNIVQNGSETENLGRIGEDEDNNPLAIVTDMNPLSSPPPAPPRHHHREVSSVLRVKKEEVESKIGAWQTAKVAKVNNRFKREDAIISGWENEQVQKASSWMKKVERKLEEKRAKAMERMQNDVAKARRKAEERRASAEGKRGTKVAKILEIANLMRAVGRPPVKRSFF